MYSLVHVRHVSICTHSLVILRTVHMNGLDARSIRFKFQCSLIFLHSHLVNDS